MQLAGIWLLLPIALHAQTRDPARFRDSLEAVADVPALYRLERSLEMPGAARSVGPILERGLIARRIYELTADREDAARARDAFKRAVERFPADPWSHYGSALALASSPEAAFTAVGGVLSDVTLLESIAELRGGDPRSRARRELRRTLELAPAFGDAAILLATLAVADGGRHTSLVREARDALVQVRAAGATGNGVTSALAKMENYLGNYATAAQVVNAGADAGDALALKARGESLMLQPGHEEDGGRDYLRAISLLTPAAATAMYEDAQVLLTPAEAAEWKNATLDQQKSWLTRFWERRAAESGVSVTDRIATHYRRLALAKQKYVRNSTRGSAGGGVLTANVPAGTYPFDQRGVMLVRHGLPVTIVTTHAPAALPNETWVYNIPDAGAEMFHFVALRGSHDYSLITDITKAIDPQALPDQRNSALITLLQDRIPFEQKYQAAATRLNSMLDRNPTLPLDGTDIRAVLEGIDADYRRGVRDALRKDSDRREYDADIAYQSDVFTFRTPFSRTELTAAFALPAKDLEPMAGSNGTHYAIRLSVIVIDTLQSTVTRTDTTIEVDTVHKLAPDDFVHAHVTLAVIPSEFTKYVLVAEDVASGNGSRTEGNHPLRDYSSSDRLLVSDIVLAVPDTAGDWKRGPQRLALALPRRFEPSRPFTVFYELYNLMPGEEYSTHITVAGVEGSGAIRRIKGVLGGNTQPIELGFDGVAAPDAAGVQQEIRKVASDLPAGKYKMTVVVTGKTSHRTATTETTFTVTN